MTEVQASVGALVLLICANFLRIYRWNTWLLSIHQKPGHRTLIAYCAGQILNLVLPLKMGDLVRVLFSRRRKLEIIGITCLLISERLLDSISVLTTFMILRIPLNLFLVLITSICVTIIVSNRLLGYSLVKRFFNNNETIKLVIWTIRKANQRIVLRKQVITTSVIWVIQIASDVLIIKFKLGQDIFSDVSKQYLSRLYEVTANPSFEAYSNQRAFLFGAVTINTVLLLSILKTKLRQVIGFVNETKTEHEKLARIEFDHFSGDLKSFRAITQPEEMLIGTFESGSNSHVVLLVRSDGLKVVRKFSEFEDSNSLRNQFQLIQSYQNKSFGFPKARKVHDKENFFCYEMDYLEECVTLHEIVKQPNVDFQKLFKDIDLQYRNLFIDIQKTDKGAAWNYVDVKVNRFISSLSGHSFSRDSQPLIDELHTTLISRKVQLAEVIQESHQIKGHGDFSSTNIMVGKKRIVFIDPLPNQLWSTKTVDWAKLYFSTSSQFEDTLVRMRNKDGVLDNSSSSHISIINFSESARVLEFLRTFCVQDLCISEEALKANAALHCLRVVPYRLGKKASINDFWLQFSHNYVNWIMRMI